MYFHDCNGGAGKKIGLEEDTLMQWNTQAGNITTDFKVKIYFTLPTLIVTNVATWTYHVNESAEGRYYMILGRYILT